MSEILLHHHLDKHSGNTEENNWTRRTTALCRMLSLKVVEDNPLGERVAKNQVVVVVVDVRSGEGKWHFNPTGKSPTQPHSHK
jgi:ribosomal protein L15E